MAVIGRVRAASRNEDVEMLTKYLPKPDGDNFNWPQFLTAYSQPAKRIEHEENRRERLRRWPESWLTKEDQKFVHGGS